MAEDRRRFDALEPKLREGLLKLGLEAPGETVSTLLDFLAELTLWNRRYSLIRATEEDLIVRHVLDSLAPIATIRRELEAASRALPGPALGSAAALVPGLSILDLGTGAGFPGVPLCVVGGLSLTLLDRSERATTFLRAAVARLRLERCTVVCGDASALGDRFPLVVTRALSPGGAEGLRRAAGLLEPEGRVVVYAGTRESAEGWATAAEGLFGSVSIETLGVPFLNAPRHVVVLSGRG